MGGKPLRLGPFIGGLNIGSDTTAIADSELVQCLNMELDIDGSLVSRPSIQELDGPNTTQRILLLCEAIFSGNNYIIGSNSSGVYYYLNGTWTLITSTFEATDAVQYAGYIYFICPPNSGQTSGKWNPTAGYVAVAAIPRGRSCIIHKERLFVAPGYDATTNESRLIFSNVGNFDTWSGSDFVDVGQGDGTKLLDIVVYQDNLLLFKNESTYVMAYDTRPTDAVVRKISPTIGLDGQHCVVNYENQVYIMHNSWVYEIVNYDFNRLNTKVPFVLDQTAPGPFATTEQTFLSIFLDRIIIRYYSKIYVYGLRTRTFSEWTAAKDTIKYFGPIIVLHLPAGDQYYAGSCITTFPTLVRLNTTVTATSKEQATKTVLTTSDTFTRTVSNGWGTSDTGQTWTPISSPSSDFSTNGTNGLINLSALNVHKSIQYSPSYTNFEIFVSVSTPVLATGAWIIPSVQGRIQSSTTYYETRVEFKNTGNVGVSLYKVVSAVETFLGGVEIGTYAINELHNLRFQISGSTLKTKLWKAAASEPGAWTIVASDPTISSPGPVSVNSFIQTGNTNTLPIALKFDNFSSGDMSGSYSDIQCSVITKNFDMAVPNQFKRLWWWGADVSTNRNIVGTATPIVVTFTARWADVQGKPWLSIQGNKWSQPLTTPVGIVTTVMSGSGTFRRFVKFLKSLRFRQVNFRVDLVTDGSLGDGPAKLFTMMIITATKETVPKALN